MGAFWAGLSRQCRHDNIGEVPISFQAVPNYLESNHKDVSLPAMRNAAMVAVGFFGVRWGAEIINFRLGNMMDNAGNGIQLRATGQKNDQLGLT